MTSLLNPCAMEWRPSCSSWSLCSGGENRTEAPSRSSCSKPKGSVQNSCELIARVLFGPPSSTVGHTSASTKTRSQGRERVRVASDGRRRRKPASSAETDACNRENTEDIASIPRSSPAIGTMASRLRCLANSCPPPPPSAANDHWPSLPPAAPAAAQRKEPPSPPAISQPCTAVSLSGSRRAHQVGAGMKMREEWGGVVVHVSGIGPDIRTHHLADLFFPHRAVVKWLDADGALALCPGPADATRCLGILRGAKARNACGLKLLPLEALEAAVQHKQAHGSLAGFRGGVAAKSYVPSPAELRFILAKLAKLAAAAGTTPPTAACSTLPGEDMNDAEEAQLAYLRTRWSMASLARPSADPAGCPAADSATSVATSALPARARAAVAESASASDEGQWGGLLGVEGVLPAAGTEVELPIDVAAGAARGEIRRLDGAEAMQAIRSRAQGAAVAVAEAGVGAKAEGVEGGKASAQVADVNIKDAREAEETRDAGQMEAKLRREAEKREAGKRKEADRREAPLGMAEAACEGVEREQCGKRHPGTDSPALARGHKSPTPITVPPPPAVAPVPGAAGLAAVAFRAAAAAASASVAVASAAVAAARQMGATGAADGWTLVAAEEEVAAVVGEEEEWEQAGAEEDEWVVA